MKARLNRPKNEGSGLTRRTPRHFWGAGPAGPARPLPCGRHILALLRGWTGGVRGIVLNSLSLYARATLALAAVAIAVAGCADSRVASNSAASGQAEQPYKTGYGFTSDGPNTDLYTELFGPRKTEAAPATAAATTQQMQPSIASTAP